VAEAATETKPKRGTSSTPISNFEKQGADSIREQAKQRGLSHLFDDIMVPKEKVVEVRRGRKVDAERKFFPGYVLVKMNLTDEAYHLIKNTPKVTGFLGADNKPMPISEGEAQRILNQVQEGIERPKPSISFEVGEQVRVSTARSHRSRHGRGSRRGPFAPQGRGLDLRPRDAGRARIRAGREALSLLCSPGGSRALRPLGLSAGDDPRPIVPAREQAPARRQARPGDASAAVELARDFPAKPIILAEPQKSRATSIWRNSPCWRRRSVGRGGLGDRRDRYFDGRTSSIWRSTRRRILLFSHSTCLPRRRRNSASRRASVPSSRSRARAALPRGRARMGRSRHAHHTSFRGLGDLRLVGACRSRGLVFVDGSHARDYVMADTDTALRLIAEKGWSLARLRCMGGRHPRSRRDRGQPSSRLATCPWHESGGVEARVSNTWR